MAGNFVNKTTVDREKLRTNEERTVNFLRYTGDDLVRRDMRKLIEVVYRNFEELNTSPELNHTRNEIARVITSPTSITIIGSINGIISCYLIAGLTQLDDLKTLMHIHYIYTSPMYRGNGLATYMLNLIEKYSIAMGIGYLSLTFDTYDKKLEEFYMNNGFMYDSNLRSYQRHDMLVKYL